MRGLRPLLRADGGRMRWERKRKQRGGGDDRNTPEYLKIGSPEALRKTTECRKTKTLRLYLQTFIFTTSLKDFKPACWVLCE